MTVTRFEDLTVWQEAASLAVEIYRVSKHEGLVKDFGLRDQLQRAAVSIASNIAEGKERETIAEFIRYLYIAKGSSGELKTQLIIAQRIGCLGEGNAQSLILSVEQISAKLGALIRTLKRK
ncbi:MAG: hypothetical protein LZF86_190271 [Nitrospira sp.]|nr:MAG: hypothetical protein LZF86_190271 [Nitrospira sp.]